MPKIKEYKPAGDGVLVVFEDGESKIFYSSEIVEAFQMYGGSFVNALWFALYRADRENTRKILTTWENYVREYIQSFLYANKE